MATSLNQLLDDKTVLRAKAESALDAMKKIERRRKMFSMKLADGTVFSASSKRHLKEIIEEYKNEHRGI